MKRNQFLKNMVAFTGGSILLSCKAEVISDFLTPEVSEDIEIDDAQKWFQESYLKQFANSNSRLGNDQKRYKRNANWDKAKKIKDLKSRECIMVPIKYETTDTPGFIMWDEQTAYKQKLPQYYAQPIIECLLVYKSEGKYDTFLAQISYDRYNLKKKNKTIDFGKLNGFLLKADWDDNIISGAKVSDGKIVAGFVKNSKNARMMDCVTYTSSYTTVSVSSCGNNCYSVTFTLHVSVQSFCPASPPFPIPHDTMPPFDEGSGSGYTNTYDVTRNYIPQIAVCQPGSSDRATMNQNLNDITNALGLATDIAGFSWDKAEAISRSIGGNLDQYLPTAGVIGKRIGMVGIALDGYQVIVGITDGDFSWDMNGDLGNTLQLALGIGSLFVAPWVAVGFGAISIGVAIYASTQPPCN